MKAWYGRSAGTSSDNGDELLTRSAQVARDAMEHSGEEVVRLLSEAITGSPLAAVLAARGLNPREAALTLEAVGHGLKHLALTRHHFSERLAWAIALVTGSPAGLANNANSLKS
jgi:hypothetical protein